MRRALWVALAAFVTCALVLLCLSGCDPSAEDLKAIDYAPLSRDDGWTVLTPEAEGLDPMLVARLFYFAERVQTIKALLVIKNGHLIAEGYFNGGGPDQSTKVQSVTKSYVSALVGIAIEQGYIQSLDQKMMDFFPELEGQIRDPRKRQITIRQLLQMRAGYPWEESSKELFDVLYRGFMPSDIVDIPLVRDPGTGFDYSNLSPHILSIIVTRATGMDVLDFAQQCLTPSPSARSSLTGQRAGKAIAVATRRSSCRPVRWRSSGSSTSTTAPGTANG